MMNKLVAKTSSLTVEKVVIHKFGGPEVLHPERSELQPDPERGILVETWVIGVGYVDVMAQRGGYFLAPKRPFSPGYECVGRVINAYGSDQFSEGDIVGALLPQMGTYQTMLEIPESRLVKLPAEVDPVKCAAAILNYLTACCILDRKGKIRDGDTVLIHGAAGGVGTALAQLGRMKSLKMYGTASAGKHDLLRELGVQPIDYRIEDFVQPIKAEHPEGIDAAFDAIGGRNLSRSTRVVKRGGVVVSYGLSGDNYGGYLEMIKGVLTYITLNLKPDGKRVVLCATPAESVQHPDWYQRTLARIFQQIKTGELDPIVDRIFPLQDVRAAHAYLEAGKVRGKILLTTPAFSHAN